MTIEFSERTKKQKDEADKRNEELNILLVVVSSASLESPRAFTWVQMGLLAATITIFIVYIQPQLQPDPGEESADLLRVLLYNKYPTVFANTAAPELPTPTGAPALLTIAQVILYACLAATLLSGLYAMLIKFLTDSNALNWQNRVVKWFTRWVFFVIYLLLSGVFFWVFVALTLQVPFLPSKTTIHLGALGKLGGLNGS